MMLKKMIVGVLCMGLIVTGLYGSLETALAESGPTYFMPVEEAEHEGTWLQWPHNFTYGEGHKASLQSIWIKMTKELIKGENVHIIAYNEDEKDDIKTLLESAAVDMDRVTFYIMPTDDVWVRDNGPVFVYDNNGNLVMLNWGFNGWGKKTPYKNCKEVPKQLEGMLDMPRVDLTKVVLEGGAVELDGEGTLLTTRSSVSNKTRNPNLTEKQIEAYIKKYYNVKNVVWLDGVVGADITDFHIDGFAKFFNGNKLFTMKRTELEEWGASDKDIDKLLTLKNANGKKYEHIYLPLTKKNVVLKSGKKLDYKGSYLNFYIGNAVVLVPNYNDSNDAVANKIIQKMYPNRKVVGIDVRELYKEGGMIHCVTQQQPISK